MRTSPHMGKLTGIVSASPTILSLTRTRSKPDTRTIRVRTSSLQSSLARCFKALRRAALKIKEETKGQLQVEQLFLFEGSGNYVMKTTDWTALADLVKHFPHLHLFSPDIKVRSGITPPAFLLSLRQHISNNNLRLTFPRGNKAEHFLSLLVQQTQDPEAHAPPISPFAIDSLVFEGSLPFSGVGLFARLGRAAPRKIHIDCGWGPFRFSRGETPQAVLALLEANYWNDPSASVEWVQEEGVSREACRKASSEVDQGMRDFFRRNSTLCVTTMKAAPCLLRAARPLLCRKTANISPADQPKPSSHVPPAQTVDLASPASLPTTSPLDPSPAPPTTSAPILFVPYDILDLILSHLFPGALSSGQHQFVLNWAEDRSTLRFKASSGRSDPHADFLQKTNCYKWESEVERVNQGYGYE